MGDDRGININERLGALMARRELSLAKRLQLKRKRLSVDMAGFKTHYEDL
jgi:hypothetical protein